MTVHPENSLFLPTRRPWAGIVMILAALTLTGCSSIPSSRVSSDLNIADACSIVHNRNDWYQSMEQTYRKWGVPVSVQMAIIYQESRFKADARPPRKKLFGFFPGPRPSTAFGFAQALDGTWDHYMERTNRHGADRDDFDDATDFIGWYTNISHRKLRISKQNARAQYLAYHEGHGGYKRKTYRKKKWLLKVADKVAASERRYRAQLARCEKKPSGLFSWLF